MKLRWYHFDGFSYEAMGESLIRPDSPCLKMYPRKVSGHWLLVCYGQMMHVEASISYYLLNREQHSERLLH